MRYSAFISYNHRDAKIARWLHRSLEGYRFPKRLKGRKSALGPLGDRLPPIFQDREELATSSDLAASVRQALSESHSLIVICSPSSAQSRWVNEEIRFFTALGRRDRIQCLVVAGEPNASSLPSGQAEIECLPPALFEDGGSEPLASDIRPGQDGRSAARLKLIAGILSIPFDELRQRELARRQRRLTVLAAAGAAGFLFMTGLATLALISRKEAIAQRDLAREKTLTAERTAEFVQSLFEVADPSEARGAQITAEEVLDKGAERIRHSLSREPNVKAELMTTLSRVYLGLGSYRRGEAIIRESMELKVTDPTIRAQQLLELGSSAYRQGYYEQAIRFYRQALALVQHKTGDAAPLRAQLLASIGDASSRAGDTSAGPRGMLVALDLDTKNFGQKSTQAARDLEALGVYYQSLSDYSRARSYYDRAVGIRLVAQGLSHPLVSEDLNELGTIAYLQNDAQAAQAYWTKALDSDVLVLGADHPDVAFTIANLARVQLEQRKFEQAKGSLQRAIDITLKNRSATNDSLAFLYANLGIAYRGLSKPDEAVSALYRALEVAELTKHRNTGPVLTELADIFCTKREWSKAMPLLDRASALTRTDYPDDPWRLAWVANTRGKCLVSKGDKQGGRALLRGSMPEIRKRWPVGTLYRAMAEQRLAAA